MTKRLYDILENQRNTGIIDVEEVFDFIHKRREEKSEYNSHVNEEIRDAFNSLATTHNGKKAVKDAYARWLLSTSERKDYDNVLYKCNGQLGFNLDIKQTINDIDDKVLDEKINRATGSK